MEWVLITLIDKMGALSSCFWKKIGEEIYNWIIPLSPLYMNYGNNKG